MLDRIKENKLFAGISLVIILCIVASFFWLAKNNKIASLNKLNTMDSAYTIPNVPYYGVHNHFAKYLNYNANSIFSVVEYWNPGLINSLEGEEKIINTDNIGGILTFFENENFTAKTINLSLSDLKNYINPEVRTPLLLSLPITVNQPDTIAYYPLTVLIGLNENEQKLIFHNYWLGNNYEISYNEFNQLESRLPADKRNSYIVIQPKNLDEKLAEVTQRKIETYPARTSIMQNGEKMLKNYAIGSAAYNLKVYGIAREYLLEVEGDTNFNEYLPPFFKTGMANMLGRIYYTDGDVDNAFLYAQKAVADDHDLNQPFKDWPGIVLDWRMGDVSRFSNSYNLLGDVYRQKKDSQKANESYVEALKIMPDSTIAKSGIITTDVSEK